MIYKYFLFQIRWVICITLTLFGELYKTAGLTSYFFNLKVTHFGVKVAKKGLSFCIKKVKKLSSVCQRGNYSPSNSSEKDELSKSSIICLITFSQCFKNTCK